MTMNFKFVFNSETDQADYFPIEKTLEADLVFDDAVSWDKVLEQFLQFLGSCYGYDITNQVRYEDYDEKIARLKEKLGDWDDEEEESTEGREFQ